MLNLTFQRSGDFVSGPPDTSHVTDEIVAEDLAGWRRAFAHELEPSREASVYAKPIKPQVNSKFSHSLENWILRIASSDHRGVPLESRMRIDARELIIGNSAPSEM